MRFLQWGILIYTLCCVISVNANVPADNKKEHPAWEYVIKAREQFDQDLEANIIQPYLDTAKQLMTGTKVPPKVIGHFNMIQGFVLHGESNIQDALVYANNAINYFLSQPFDKELVMSYYLLGKIKHEIADYKGAIEDFLTSAAYADTIGDIKLHKRTLNGIGACFYYLGEYEKAYSYFKDYYDYAVEIQDTFLISNSLNSIASTLIKQGEFDKSIGYVKRAISLGKKSNYVELILYLNVADAYYMAQNYDSSKIYLDTCRTMLFEHKIWDLASRYYFLDSKFKYQVSNLKGALESVNSAIDYANIYKNNRVIVSLWSHKADILSKSGDNLLAFQTLQKSIHLKDSIWNDRILQQSNQLERKFQLQDKVRQIEVQQLKLDKQEQLIQSKQRRNITLGMIAGLLLVVVIFIIYYSSKLKRINSALKFTNLELADTVKTRDKIMSIIAHDIKNPINTIFGFSELLNGMVEEKDAQIYKYSGYIYRSIERLYILIENLLDWSMMQRGVMKINKKSLNLNSLMQNNIHLLEGMVEEKHIKLINQVEEDTFIFADERSIQTVFRNIISNAVKFTDKEGSVTISARRNAQNIEIDIKDTGVGISQEDIGKIFKPETDYSKIGEHEEKGTGLGLGLCKELVEKNDGEIFVSGKIGIGTTFTIVLPVK